MQSPDPHRPFELARGVWWVGQWLEGDAFQCHAYLVQSGDEAVLIDPGGPLTWDAVRAKVEQVTPLESVRWVVAHHQDPDVIGCMPALDRELPHAKVVTHWRAEALLRHYGPKNLRFWLVDQNEWRLQLPDRCLEFVFTPYAHFPGAFVTFDPESGFLFSSDLFGGFTEGFQLFAKDLGYFEAMRPFHEHYIPTREILDHAVTAVRRLPIRTIAPQHGSLIPEPLVGPLLDRLRSLDCGIYLLAAQGTDIARLSLLNAALRDLTRAMILFRDFKDIAEALEQVARKMLDVQSLAFLALRETDALSLEPTTRYRGESVPVPRWLHQDVGRGREDWLAAHGRPWRVLPVERPGAPSRLVVPLFLPGSGTLSGACVLALRGEFVADEHLELLLAQLAVPLQVALERELLLREVDEERQHFYERSTRDALTGLFTRFYMNDAVGRLLRVNDRDPNARVAVVMCDVDHFKRVNDTFGHPSGDMVLKRVSRVILEGVRSTDIAVRLGGEEFAVFLPDADEDVALTVAERLRARVEAIALPEPMQAQRTTVSAGTAVRRPGESLDDVLSRADAALYRAKTGGRNRVCCDDQLAALHSA